MLKDYTVVYTEEDEEEEPEGPVPFTHVMGKKQYELTNHLGNVLATVSDVKLGYDDDEVEDGYKQSSGSDGLADYYMPYMYTATQYYPFGSPLPGRDFVLQSTCDTTVVNDTLEVVNEAFATGVGGFVSLNAGGTVSNESGQLKFQKTCTTPGCPAYGGDRTFTQVSGETYTVKFDLSLPGTCSPTVTVKVLDPSNGVISTQTYNTSGTKSFTFTTTAGGTGKIEFSATTCTVFYIDNLNIGYTAQTTCITCHGGYRFGFNGKEKTDEWQGGGMSYDYGFRIHDPRLGRFLSVDPLTQDFPWYSPYQYAGNKPVWCRDIDGLEDGVSTTMMVNNWERQDKKYANGEITWDEYVTSRTRSQMAYGIGGVAGLTAASLFYGIEAALPMIQGMTATGIIWMSNPANQHIIVGVGGLTASIIDPNPTSDYPGGLDDIARGVRLLFKNSNAEKFILNSSKFDYFFGKVQSSKHNTERSLQNAKDLATLGIKDDKAGRDKLAQIIEQGIEGQFVKEVKSEYGTTVFRKVEIQNGDNKGAINIGYFYPGGNMSSTPEISTIVPQIYN